MLRDQPPAAVILAAGLGTRMRSRTPKVLHPIAGRPMIDHVLDACAGAGIRRVVLVLNPAAPEVADHVRGRAETVFQERQLGSGHALAQAPADVLGGGDVVVVNGDAPLLRPGTLERLVQAHREAGTAATLASVIDPARRDARILRNAEGDLDRIVEYRDASEAQRALGEINVGLYVLKGGSELMQALAMLQPHNAAGELYLTDIFGALKPVHVVTLTDRHEAMGVNDRVELAAAEKVMRARNLEALMRGGVTVVDPDTTWVDSGVRVGQDTVIWPNTLLRGSTSIGRDCTIGPGADILDCELGDGCRVEHSWLRGAVMGEGSDCGPFAKLRPGTRLGVRVHVGSFAELVRSEIGSGTAVPHVSYLGDATVGENVNVGAGTITANYDGVGKNPTRIGSRSFVGVDTMFVAPVEMGSGAKTGAGSVVTKDIPDGATAVGIPARVVKRRAPE